MSMREGSNGPGGVWVSQMKWLGRLIVLLSRECSTHFGVTWKNNNHYSNNNDEREREKTCCHVHLIFKWYILVIK